MTVQSYTTKRNEKDFTYNIKKPSAKDYQEAKLYSNKMAAEITQQRTKEGKPAFILRSQVSNLLVEMGLWDEKIQQELVDTTNKIVEGERKLAKGGAAGLTKKQGRALALEISSLRAKQFYLLAKSREMDTLTLEAQIENANFDYLVANCLLDEEGNRVFTNVEDYRENGSEAWVTEAAGHLANTLYGLDEDREKQLPENQFLIKYKFVNENLEFIDSDGNLVNEDGQRIDKDGYLLDAEGQRVDSLGNKLDENGKPVEEFQEFLPDE